MNTSVIFDTRVHSLTFRVRRCCHSNETRAPIAKPPHSAKLNGSSYHFPNLHPGPYSSVGMRRGTIYKVVQKIAQSLVLHIFCANRHVIKHYTSHYSSMSSCSNATSIFNKYINYSMQNIRQRYHVSKDVTRT